MENKYNAKGTIVLVHCNDEIKAIKHDLESMIKEHTKWYASDAKAVELISEDIRKQHSYSIIGDLMTGIEFYEAVDSGCIIDYDGMLGEVFVDGYISNLGLCHKGLCQGEFLVDGNSWKALCEEHTIEVIWCNK